jgi:hypothetical protein
MPHIFNLALSMKNIAARHLFPAAFLASTKKTNITRKYGCWCININIFHLEETIYCNVKYFNQSQFHLLTLYNSVLTLMHTI